MPKNYNRLFIFQSKLTTNQKSTYKVRENCQSLIEKEKVKESNQKSTYKKGLYYAQILGKTSKNE